MQNEWFSSWFDTPYYHTLYKNRDDREACVFIDYLTQFLQLSPHAMCWDLCCGKGRHSIYLNKKGYNVIGTDLSDQSIKEANKQANETLQFHEHDMRNMFRLNHFDAVLNLFTSFGYFDNKEDDLKVFSSVQKSLKNDGLFVLDFLNATYVRNNLVENDLKEIDGITFHIAKTIENNMVVKKINFSDRGEHFSFEERVHLYDKMYFEALAKQSGLEMTHTFGNYHLEKFDERVSPRLILVFKKTNHL
jgi:SAM-dependent methyltransferase